MTHVPKSVFFARRQAAGSQGMALVLVLWIVAALSIFAMGLGSVLRQEAALVNVSRNMAYGRAAGEAAIFEALRRMAAQPQEMDAMFTQTVVLMGRNIELQIVPWSGFVNINAAPAPLLAMLFQQAAQMPPAAAEALAQTVVQVREAARTRSGSGVAWDAPEDLLQVPGMGYAIFSKVREYMVAEAGARQGVDPAAAREPLRSWLQSGSGAAWRQSGSSTRYSITANVLFDGQGIVQVRRQVSISRSTEQGRLPWKLHAASLVWQGSM